MKKLYTLLFFISILLCAKIGFSQNIKSIEIESSVYEQIKHEGKLNPSLKYKIRNTSTPASTLNTIITDNPVLSGTCQSLANISFSPITALLNQDDGSTQVNLPFNFCFYGATYTSCFVNSNGNISFDAAMNAFSSTGFPTSPDKVIAPFWADFDNRGGNGIVKMFMGADYLIVTWDSIGYYDMQGAKRNTCSVILTNGSSPLISSGNNVGFIYENMDWTTGDASNGTNGFGGTPATIGVNKGDGTTFFQVGRFSDPGSNYYGNTALNNGVDWLDNKSFFFNTCPSTNIAPISTNYSSCDTIKMCNFSDALLIENYFASPEVNQNTTVSVSAPTLGANISTYLNTSGPSAHIINQVIANPSLLGYHTITYTATDNGIPIQTTTITLTLNITTGTTVAPQITISPSSICPGDSVALGITNCSNFLEHTWSNGTTGCNTVIDSAIAPFLIVKDFNGCTQTTPIDITIKPIPTPLVIGNTNACLQQGVTTVQLAPKDLDEPNYTQITWNPGNVSGNNFTASTGTYTVSITGDNGCINDTVFEITKLNMPEIIESNYCLTSIPKDSLQLLQNLSCAIGASCSAVGTFTCTDSASTIQIGNQGLTAATNPTPFLGYWEDGKSQHLYRSAELQSQGIGEGIITSLALNIPVLSSTSPYNNLSIKLKCTNTNQFVVGAFESGAITVYSNSAYTASSGWNTFVFNSPYKYDGTSNLIVEICFDNSSWSATDNVEYSNTTYNSTSAMDQDLSAGCSFANSERVINAHPNIRFNYIYNVNTNNFNFSWLPTTGLSNPTILNPKILPNTGNTTYTLTVSNLSSTCTNQYYFNFNVDENNPLIVTQPIGDTVCVLQNFSLNTLVGGIVSNYTWKKNGITLVDNATISGSNTNTLSISSASATNQGWYKCYIAGNCVPALVTDSVFVKIKNCVGVNNLIANNQLKIYPNPASNNISLIMPSNYKDYKKIVIYDVVGKQIKTISLIGNKEENINISDLSDGFYTISLIGDNKKLVQSFIKE